MWHSRHRKTFIYLYIYKHSVYLHERETYLNWLLNNDHETPRSNKHPYNLSGIIARRREVNPGD